MPEELAKAPAIPELTKHLWNYFIQLDSRRSGSGFGANPISYADLAGWEAVSRVTLETWEREAIFAIDILKLTVDSERADRERQKAANK